MVIKFGHLSQCAGFSSFAHAPTAGAPPYGSIGLLLKVFTMPLTTYSTQLNQTRPIDRRDLIDGLSINGLSLAVARYAV